MEKQGNGIMEGEIGQQRGGEEENWGENSQQGQDRTEIKIDLINVREVGEADAGLRTEEACEGK